MEVVVLLNPRSGTAREAHEVEACCKALGADCTLLSLSDADVEERGIRAAAEVDVLVAAGGDGTINLAVNLLMRSGGKAALGVMPMGTCNDLSRTLDIPADLEESVEVIVRGCSRPIDVVALDGGRYMINQANGGASGRLAEELDEETKSRWGPAGYWLAAMDVITDLPEYEVTAVLDGREVQGRVVNLTVANARYSGGGVPVAPTADPTDGALDVLLFESASRMSLLGSLSQILSGSHLGSKAIRHERGRRLELSSDPAMPFSIDGELFDEHPAWFELLPGALTVRVPR